MITLPIERIAYYMQLDNEYVYVSADAFTQNLKQIGVPNTGSGAFWQQILSNMNVMSNKAGITTGTGIATGNIEFWPSNYGLLNTFGIPGASDTAFDFDDSASTGSVHGSMQLHNYGAAQTLFAYNRWGSFSTGSSELGLGNAPAMHTDWTFQTNAHTYTTRALHVMVKTVTPQTKADVVANAPAAADYELIYSLVIPDGQAVNFALDGVPYYLDNSDSFTSSFRRVAYYLELDNDWVYVSMDAFTDDVKKIGAPTNQSGALFQMRVSNMNVLSNKASMTTGTGIATGLIEFWPHSYSAANQAAVPGASGSVFDFGDMINLSVSVGYASMQVHNYAATTDTVLFAFNHWNAYAVSSLGIGDNPGAHPDYTFADNADSYTTRILHVLALPGENPYDTMLAEVGVPEAADYEVVYAAELQVSPGWDYQNNFAPYALDRSASAGPYDRVAYFLRLDDEWVYASFEEISADAGLIGLPIYRRGAVYQQNVYDLNVFSNKAGIATGAGLGGGNIEFWSANYSADNARGVPNASSQFYDTGDIWDPASADPGYGSLQIHNHDANQTLIAYNRWGNQTGHSDVGLGNNPDGGGNPDWTFAQNTNDYTTRTLLILARPATLADALVAQSDGATAVMEGGPADSFELALTSQPTSPVTITLTPTWAGQPSQDLDLGAGAGQPIALTFTESDWDTTQTVTVTAVDDAELEPTETAQIKFTIASNDPAFDGTYSPPVTVTIYDNEPKPRLEIYLLAGQSNADGHGDTAALPPEWNQTFTDVDIYRGVPDSGFGSWTDLMPGLGGNANKIGPELSYGRELKNRRPFENIAVIKYARGATNLHTQWFPDPAGAQWSFFWIAFDDAMARLEQDVGPYEPVFRGMAWMQGESDSQQLVNAQAYEDNLTTFIWHMRQRLNAPDLPFVIGQISDASNWTHGAVVQAAQETVALADPHTSMVITSDLPFNVDGIHYNTTGNLILGERFAGALLGTAAAAERAAGIHQHKFADGRAGSKRRDRDRRCRGGQRSRFKPDARSQQRAGGNDPRSGVLRRDKERGTDCLSRRLDAPWRLLGHHYGQRRSRADGHFRCTHQSHRAER